MLYSSLVSLASIASTIYTVSAKNVTPIKIDFDIYDEIGDRELVKRDGTMDMTLGNKRLFYILTLKMGLRNDTVQVLVDTGSLDLWVPLSDITCLSSSSYSSKRSLEQNFDAFTIVKRIALNDEDVDIENTPRDLIQPDLVDAQAKAQITATPTVDRDTLDSSSSSGSTQEKFGFFTWSTITISVGGSGGSPGALSSLLSDYTFATNAATAASNTCIQYGLFATESLTLFHENTTAPDFQIQYADGTSATGIWGYDTVSIGDTEIENLLFAIANQLSSDVGVLGIGYPSLETTNQYGLIYQNLPQKLVADGIIGKSAFSVYLNSQTATSGSILFGGIDHAKYTGQLQTVPIIGPTYARQYSDKNRIIIVLSSLTFSSSTQNITMLSENTRALLDTGLTASYFPALILKNIGTTLGGTYSSSLGTYIVDCTSNKDYNIIFNFSGIKISVPYSNLVYSSGSTCYLGLFQQTSLSYAVLGDNFLRSAYVVYDLEDDVIAMAQVDYSTDTNIEVISLLIPSAVQAASYLSTSVYSGTISGSTNTASISLGSSSSSSSSGTKTSAAGMLLIPSIFVAISTLTALAVFV